MRDTQAGLINLTLVIAFITAARYGTQWTGALLWRLRRRRRFIKHVRAWRRRLTAVADQPFYFPSLTTYERSRFLGRNGQTSEQWARAAAADIDAGHRTVPTFGDYLAEFGRHPKPRRA